MTKHRNQNKFKKKDWAKKCRAEEFYAKCGDKQSHEQMTSLLSDITKSDSYLPHSHEIVEKGLLIVLEHDNLQMITPFIPYLTHPMLINVCSQVMRHPCYNVNTLFTVLELSKDFESIKDHALHFAIQENHLSFVPLLLTFNAKIQSDDFFIACQDGKETLLQLLIDHSSQDFLARRLETICLHNSRAQSPVMYTRPWCSYSSFQTVLLALKTEPDLDTHMQLMYCASFNSDEKLLHSWPFVLNREIVLRTLQNGFQVWYENKILLSIFRVLGPKYLTDNDILKIQLCVCKTGQPVTIQQLYDLRPEVSEAHVKVTSSSTQLQFLLDRGGSLDWVSNNPSITAITAIKEKKEMVLKSLCLCFKSLFHQSVVNRIINSFINYNVSKIKLPVQNKSYFGEWTYTKWFNLMRELLKDSNHDHNQ